MTLNRPVLSPTAFVRPLLFLLIAISCLPLAAQRGESELNPAPPSGMSVEQIIQQFAAKESEFAKARENYTWHQSVKVQELDGDTVTGTREQESDILFDDRGQRVDHVTFAPQDTLQKISWTRQDDDDLRQRMPFTVTTETMPEYNIKYVGQQREDELNTYVFDLSPKTIEKNKRYFEGRIWVDDHDFQIVKTFGKSVPDIKSGGSENLFPKFTTWRTQVDERYWFPAYTLVDDTLHFKMGDVHLRQIVKYTNYKRFGSKSKIIFEGQEVKKDPNAPPNQQQPDDQQPHPPQPPPDQNPK
jgi:hypothetical protein